jgi:hypothetical protein
MVVTSKTTPKRSSKKNYLTTNVAIVAVVVAIIIAWLLLHFVYENPNTVFYSMLNNALSTSSFSKKVVSYRSNAVDYQSVTAQTGANNIVASKEIQATIGNRASEVSIYSVGTPWADYSKYLSITTTQRDKNGTLLNYKPVINIWTKNTPGPKNSPQGKIFSDVLLGSVVPIGQISVEQRNSLMNYIKQNKVYNIVGKTTKRSVNGSTQYTYSVSIDLPSFVVMMGKFGDDLGLKVPPVKSSSYVGEIEAVKITVDALTRQLVGINYVGSNNVESFSSFGAKYNISVPTKTISLQDLGTKLSTVSNN